MKKNNFRQMILYVLIALITATTVAYAALSATLNVSGTVTKQGGIWDVHFIQLTNPPNNPTITGGAVFSNVNIAATSFTFNASLEKPLDSIVYTFGVTNAGSINAKLDTITLTGEATAAAYNITYKLTDSNGNDLAKDSTLNVGETKNLKLTVSYNNVSSISAEPVTLNLGATLIYVQA